MDFTNDQPIYLQIVDKMLEKILRHEWGQGMKIPSIRETAVDLEVNPNTVVRCYNLLQDRGIIINKRGIGYFVADDAYAMTVTDERERFVQVEMPQFVLRMILLGVDTAELEKVYEIQKQKVNDNEKE